MTASDATTYPGIYRARCISKAASSITAYVPQVFGTVSITVINVAGSFPDAGEFGYISFEGGDPAFPVWIGTVTNITLDPDEPLHKEMVQATHEPTGHEDKTQSVISFSDATRTFTIGPAAVDGYFDVWCKGTKYRKRGNEQVQIPNTTGFYFIYYNTEGVLTYKTGVVPTWGLDGPVAYIYWNVTTQKAEIVADERHGIVLDWATHEYLHRTRGAAIASGFSISNYVIDGNGNLGGHAQFELSGGTFFDEDHKITVVSTASPTANTFEQNLLLPARLPVGYFSGTSWKFDAATIWPVKQGTNRIQYNLNTSGTWSTVDVSNNHYTTMFVVASNNINNPIFMVLGQSQHPNEAGALEVDWADLDLTDFPLVEYRPLYKIVFGTSDSFANVPKAIIAAIEDIRFDQSVSVVPVDAPAEKIPTGTVVPFAGSTAPTGWLLCAGQAIDRILYSDLFSVISTTYGSGNGTSTFNIPDLRGRVPVALDNMNGTDAGRLSAANSLGTTGGKEDHQLTTAELASHSHSATANSATLATVEAGSHVHSVTVSLSDSGTHNHSFRMGRVRADEYLDNRAYMAGGTTIDNEGLGTNTYNFDHNTVIKEVGNHNHSATATVTPGSGAHTHSLTGNTGTQGSNTAHNNMQPYILLNYIIKT